MTEYPRHHYQRDPLHIADALDQIRRRLGKHKIEVPVGTRAFPEAPTAFDLGFLTSRLAEVVAQVADESQVRSGFNGHNRHGQHTTAVLTRATARATEALAYLAYALAEAGAHYSTQEDPFREQQPPTAVRESIHRHLARAHLQLTHTIRELRDATAEHGYTYPCPAKRVRGITPIAPNKPPSKPAAPTTRNATPRLL